MIKHKNKFITFVCACFIAIGSLFGLVGAVGNTLAYTPSLIDNTTMQDYIVNHKNYDYNNIFDGYFRFNNFTSLTSGLGILFFDFNNNLYSSLNSGGKITVSSSNFRSYALNDSGNIFQIAPNLTNYQIGYISTLFSSSTTNLLDFANKDVKCLSFLLNDGNIYNFISVSQFQIYNSYKQGLSDGDNYDTAYNDGQNNVLNNPNSFGLYTQQQYEQNYNLGVIQGQNNVLNNPNSFGLYTQQQYQDNYNLGYSLGVTQGQNNVLNNPNDFNLNTNQQLQDSYNQGFQDGEHSSSAYQNGYNNGLTDGQNNVLNNPNSFGLYTQQQYDDNYDNGYIKGKIDASLGIFANCEIYAVFLAIVDDNNYFGERFYTDDFNFNNGIITPKQNVIDSYNNFIDYVNVNNIENYTCRLSIDNLNFVYNDDININFLNLGSISSTDPVGILVHVNNDVDYSNYIYRKYTPVLDNGNFVGVNISKFDYLSYLPDNLITSLDIDFNYTMPLNLPAEFYTNNRVNFNNLKIYSTSTQFDDGYNLGFVEGVDSVDTEQYYNEGYNQGVIVGKDVGYYEGLANAENATFYSMISSVIDVPINALRNLFNIEVLGVNLFGFFTGLFTLCVIITLIRLFLGGK